jgi:tripartite ATP-independent transporter DctM subunit
MQQYLPLLMFPTLFCLIFLGIPVAFSLLVVGAAFGYHVFGSNVGLQMQGRLLDVASNFVLVAIPLFIFMGALLERSRIAESLLQALRLWLGRFPGGLSVSAIIICTLFAASSGIVGAVEIVVGLMAVPTMIAAGYRKDLVCGTICGGGSLGTIIPPSVIVVIYASITDLSIGDLLAGILIPGLVMMLLFLVYVVARCVLRPADGPPLTVEELQKFSLRHKIILLFTALLPCVGLIVVVLGSIFAGIASPTEAAAVGVLGALLLTIAYGQFSRAVLVDALSRTVTTTAMTMMIILGGTIFTTAFLVNGGSGVVRSLISGLALGPSEMLFMFLGVIFILGFLLDWISILLITIPIFNPVIVQAGIDPVWFAVMVCIVLQTSYLTPPMAPSIFYLQSIAPKGVSLADMYRGVIPFVILQLLTLVLVYLIPWMAVYMPKILFRL